MDGNSQNLRNTKTHSRKRCENAELESKVTPESAANRITANPFIVKTQVAKISYAQKSPMASTTTMAAQLDFDMKKREREREIAEFKDMLKEIATIQPTVQAKVTTPRDTARTSIASAAASSYRRCMTEMVIGRGAATMRTASIADVMRGSGTARTAYSELARSQEVFPSDSATTKKRADVRQFMDEQKRKRRASPYINPDLQVEIEKQVIKKRLEELKKNSRKIILKNVNKQRIVPSKQTGAQMTPKAQESSFRKSISRKGLNANVIGTTNNAKSAQGIVAFKTKKLITTPRQLSKPCAETSGDLELQGNSKSARSMRTEPSHRSKISNLSSVVSQSSLPSSVSIARSKRVGLLRKPETEDHSFSAIKEFSFDKENVALDMLTPKLSSLVEAAKSPSIAVCSKQTSLHEEPPKPPVSDLEQLENEIESEAEVKLQEKSTQVHNNASLNVMSAEQSKPDDEEIHITEAENADSPANEAHDANDGNDVLYWLRPSAVQVYPYNFIKAVRRKLEAIVDPTIPASVIDVAVTRHQITSTGDLSKVVAQNKSAAEVVAQQLKSVQPFAESVKILKPPADGEQPSAESIKILKPPSEDLNKSQQTLSDLHSNLSSISLRIPASNTASEVSSLKSESVRSMHIHSLSKSISRISVNHDNDDTTASSSIFSSPEKRRQKENAAKNKISQTAGGGLQKTEAPNFVTPLSEKAGALQSNIEIDFAVPRPASPLSLELVDKLKISSKYDKKSAQHKKWDGYTDEITFQKMLSDFNHSLSQVIEANEQLKSTISRSEQILSPAPNTRPNQQHLAPAHEDVYTTDFEESSYKQISHNGRANTRKHFQVTTPLLSSPRSEHGPVFELNLGSITPASTHSSEYANSESNETITEYTQSSSSKLKQLTPQSTPISPHLYEERLAAIDEVKANLRRMISDSQAQRHAMERSERCRSQHQHELAPENHTNALSSPHTELSAPTAAKSETNHQRVSPTSATNTTYTLYTSTQSPRKPETTHEHNSRAGVSTKSTTYIDSHTASVSSSQVISEDLQIAYESSSKENKTHTRRESKIMRHDDRKSENAAFVKSHINTSRGDFIPREELSMETAPPSYNAASTTKPKIPTTTKSAASAETMNSELITLFKVSDLEISCISSHDGNLSETSLNYSNVGLYEKLIKTETTKSEYLTALLKMREKALLDRTKAQLAWLEVQKERYKSRGLMLQIAAVRKKQRAILIKMEKEREDIKRLLQSTITTSSNQTTTGRIDARALTSDTERHRTLPAYETKVLHHHSQRRERHQRASTNRSQDSSTQLQQQSHSAPILRASYDLETSASLESLLRQREDDLRKRREHVERLMEWHRKLDEEEAEVLQLERLLFTYNASSGTALATEVFKALEVPQKKSPTKKQSTSSVSLPSKTAIVKRAGDMERRLREIEKSLRELNNISATTVTANSSMSQVSSNGIVANGQDTLFDVATNGNDNLDFVRTTGNKMNKLWRRLTSQHVEKFEPNRRYKLYKSDFERMYEEAKNAVLDDLARAEERSIAAELLEQSAGNSNRSRVNSIGSAADILDENASVSSVSVQNLTVDGDSNRIVVPSLNLNFSTSQSEEQEDEQLVDETDQRQQPNTMTFSLAKRLTQTSTAGDYSPSDAEQSFQSSTRSNDNKNQNASKMDRNMRKFLQLTSTPTSEPCGEQVEEQLERSLSDTQLATVASKLHSRGASFDSTPAGFTVQPFVAISPSEGSVATADTLKSVMSLKTISTASIVPLNSATTSTSGEESPGISSSEQHGSGNGDQRQHEDVQIMETKSVIETRTSVIRSTSGAESVESVSTALSSNSTQEQQQTSVSVTSENKPLPSNSPIPIVDDTVDPPSDFEHKSNEIEAKLYEISEAVARLSQSDVLSNATSSCKSTKVSTKNLNDSDSNNTSQDVSYTVSFEPPTTSNGKVLHSSISPSIDDSLVDDSNPLNQSQVENHILDTYELDFEGLSDVTNIDEISLPRFDTTFDTSLPFIKGHEVNKSTAAIITTTTNENANPAGSEKYSPDDDKNIPPPPTLPTASLSPATDSQTLIQQNVTIACAIGSPQQTQQLMPDIINELEIRRCQQLLLENEQFRQYEHVTAMPYMYMREIPNKPPPPYCPPAHGSPMTTIFPSEERIKDITYRRTHELYCEILETDHVNEKGEKLPSVSDEQITNIYERIILDICREYLTEHQEVLTLGDPTNFHSQLAFFNPPDRLRCIQESIYREVRRSLAMDKISPTKRTPVYSVYGQRAKRDHIGKLIMQDMYEEESKWCNFHREEDEVLELIIENMIQNLVEEIAKAEYIAAGGVLLEAVENVDDKADEQQQNVADDDVADTTTTNTVTDADTHATGDVT